MTIDWLNYTILSIGDFSLQVGELLIALALIIATYIVSAIVQRAINRVTSLKPTISRSHVYALNRIIHYVILVVGFILAASALGLDMTKLAIIGGALGIGIGLGLQNIVNNFFSGIILLLEQSIKVGDFIELTDGLVGEVQRINIRSTLIRTNDNVDILIPNSEFVSSRVINWTLEEDIRRFRIPFGVAYGSDKEVVKKAAIEAAESIEATLNIPGKPTQVWMTGFGDSSLDFELCVWVTPENVKRPSFMTSQYLWAIDDAFRRYNIEIPFPQRDLHFRSGVIQTRQNDADGSS